MPHHPPMPHRDDGFVRTLLAEAAELRRRGLLEEAEARCREVLRLQPSHTEALNLLASIAMQTGRAGLAADLWAQVARLEPGAVAALYNRGNALRALARHEEAVASYDAALALRPELAIAHCNRANALRDLGRSEAALDAYGRAIANNAELVPAYWHRANLRRDLGRLEDALADYGRVAALDPTHAAAFGNAGNVLFELRQFPTALEAYEAAIALDDSIDGLLGAGLYARMQMCDWHRMDAAIERIAERVERGHAAVHPFCTLLWSDSPALQRQAAAAWARSLCPADPAPDSPTPTDAGGRIRVGYFSADFRNHPVARLLAGVIECHDRERFEIIGLSTGPDTDDEMRRRQQGAFDRFIDLRGETARRAAEKAQGLGLHIAVDLGGFTEHNRPDILALRPAPVQVGYLGFLGTMGAQWMDYLIADATLIPEAERSFYAEKIIELPSYQANDGRRLEAGPRLTRRDVGLPPDGFVFCCFNAQHKLMPQTFGCWMRILGRVPGSLLWLHVEGDAAAANLRTAARDRGIDPDRLVFAGRRPYRDHLSRLRVAELFLDTLPYNAGTTASDALWMGLPLLTCRGGTFAGRMAASLLTSLDLPELILDSLADYEDAAVDLATNVPRLDRIRRRLEASRPGAALFDTRRFTATLEEAYVRIHERHRAGLPPDHLRVERS